MNNDETQILRDKCHDKVKLMISSYLEITHGATRFAEGAYKYKAFGGVLLGIHQEGKEGNLREKILPKERKKICQNEEEKALLESLGRHRRSCQTTSKPRDKSDFCL